MLFWILNLALVVVCLGGDGVFSAQLSLKVALPIPTHAFVVERAELEQRFASALSDGESHVNVEAMYAGSVVIILTISPPFSALNRWLDTIGGLSNRSAAVPIHVDSDRVGLSLEPPSDLVRIARSIIHNQDAVAAALGGAVGYTIVDVDASIVHPPPSTARSPAARAAALTTLEKQRFRSTSLNTFAQLKVRTSCTTTSAAAYPVGAQSRVLDFLLSRPSPSMQSSSVVSAPPLVAPLSFFPSQGVKGGSVVTPSTASASLPSSPAPVELTYVVVSGGDVFSAAAVAADVGSMGWLPEAQAARSAADAATAAVGEVSEWGEGGSGVGEGDAVVCGLDGLEAFAGGVPVKDAASPVGPVGMSMADGGDGALAGGSYRALFGGAADDASPGLGVGGDYFVWVGYTSRGGGGGRCCVHGNTVCREYNAVGGRMVSVCHCVCVPGYTGRACERTEGGVVTTAEVVGDTAGAPALSCADWYYCSAALGKSNSGSGRVPSNGVWVSYMGTPIVTNCSLSAGAEGVGWTPFLEGIVGLAPTVEALGGVSVFPYERRSVPWQSGGWYVSAFTPRFGDNAEVMVWCGDTVRFVTALPPRAWSFLRGQSVVGGWHSTLFSRDVDGGAGHTPTRVYVSDSGIVFSDEGGVIAAFHSVEGVACRGESSGAVLQAWMR